MAKRDQFNALYVRIWRDPAFRALSERGRNVARYVLTGPQRTSEGLYYLTPMMVADDIGCTPEQAIEAMNEGVYRKLYRYDADTATIHLPKALAYQRSTNPKHAAGIADRVANLHANPYVGALYQAAILYEDRHLVAAMDKSAAAGILDIATIPEEPGPEPAPETAVASDTPIDSPSDTGIDTYTDKQIDRYTDVTTDVVTCSTPSNDTQTPSFDDFWARWPRRDNKKRSRTSWTRLSKADRNAAYERIPEYVADVQRNPRDFMLPTTYLNNERWLDAFDAAPQKLTHAERRNQSTADTYHDVVAYAEEIQNSKPGFGSLVSPVQAIEATRENQ